MNQENLQLRRLAIFIADTTARGVIPAHVALRDLREAMLDPDSELALDDILLAWASMTLGIVKATDTIELALDLFPAAHVAPADGLNPRQALAMQIAKVTGKVASSDLQARFDVTPETIRQDLQTLAKRRLLVAQGDGRGRYYVPGRRDGTK